MIYLVRHGLDDEDYVGGWSDVALTKEGITQVHDIAEYLKKSNLKIDKIVSSDVKRAVESAEIIAKYLKVPVIKTELLRELNKGLLNGMPKEEAEIKYPVFIHKVKVDTVYPEGESMKSFYERIISSLDDILKFDNCLLVTHRGVINMLYFNLSNTKLSMNKKRFGVTHASLHQLDPETKTIQKIK